MKKEEIINEIGHYHFKTFDKWMRGQTTGVTETGEPDYYVWDYEKWLSYAKGNITFGLYRVIDKMFEAVGKKFNPQIPKKPDWFLRYSWTEKQQDEFISWFADYLYKNKDVQLAMYETGSGSKKQQTERAQFFVFSYGWKLKDGKQDTKN